MSTNRNERLQEVTAPGTPTTATVVLYAKSDGLLYWKDDQGTERAVVANAGGVVMMSGLPTSDPAVAGRLYTSAGAVKVSAG